MRYAVTIENAGGNHAGDVPDPPGCIAAGPSVQAVKTAMHSEIRFHIEGPRADGLRIRAWSAVAEYVGA